MKDAHTIDGETVQAEDASDSTLYYCPECTLRVRVRTGEKNAPHFAHPAYSSLAGLRDTCSRFSAKTTKYTKSSNPFPGVKKQQQKGAIVSALKNGQMSYEEIEGQLYYMQARYAGLSIAMEDEYQRKTKELKAECDERERSVYEREQKVQEERNTLKKEKDDFEVKKSFMERFAEGMYRFINIPPKASIFDIQNHEVVRNALDFMQKDSAIKALEKELRGLQSDIDKKFREASKLSQDITNLKLIKRYTPNDS